MRNNLKISIYTIYILGISNLFSSIYVFGQKNNWTVSDIDGNIYKTVIIGSQEWMASNLKTTKYRNGDLIGTTTPATLKISGESTPKYQWAYNGNDSNVAIYGRLYTWYAATDSRGICPTEWHIPTDAEWATLIVYLGKEAVAGGKLKETGRSHWKTLNAGATNSSGFTALPGGARYYNGEFDIIGYNGCWWSSTGYETDYAWQMSLSNLTRDVGRSYSDKAFAFSVRCIKD